MKKLTSFFTFLLIAAISFSFTSCDQDHQLALELDGTWRGTVHQNGRGFYVDMRFYQDGFSTHGYGYEYDENMRNGNSAYARFDWYVSNGNIYLDYRDGSNAHVVISDYILKYYNGAYQLDGYLQEVRDGWDVGHITLYKQSRNSYDDGYYRYIKTLQGKVEDDSATDSIK